MNSFEDIKIAIVYSYNSMTLITWLVLVFGVLKTVQAFNKAYSEHNSYKEMKSSADKGAITQFYYGVIIAFLCVIIFFLPYLINYNN